MCSYVGYGKKFRHCLKLDSSTVLSNRYLHELYVCAVRESNSNR